MDFLPTPISEYAEKFNSEEKTLLHELNRATWTDVLQPRMLSGHFQGRFLSMISHLMKPKRILEIGTYTGYSALCLAEGLAEDGILHTIEIDEEIVAFASHYFEKSPMRTKIVQHTGHGLEIIPELNEDWDLVFIDADKENYSKYYGMLIDKLKPGALILADNVLWSGKVVDEKERNKDPETAAIHAFNLMVQQDDKVENLLLPIRDGLMMVRKR